MVTPEGHAAYAKIQAALEEYFKVEAEVIALGSSTDPVSREQAQDMAFDKLAPAYENLDNVTLDLMNVNIQKEHEMEQCTESKQDCNECSSLCFEEKEEG